MSSNGSGFSRGDKVRKIKGNTKFEGVVLGEFRTLEGRPFINVEDDRQIVMHYRPDQFERMAPSEPEPGGVGRVAVYITENGYDRLRKRLPLETTLFPEGGHGFDPQPWDRDHRHVLDLRTGGEGNIDYDRGWRDGFQESDLRLGCILSASDGETTEQAAQRVRGERDDLYGRNRRQERTIHRMFHAVFPEPAGFPENGVDQAIRDMQDRVGNLLAENERLRPPTPSPGVLREVEAEREKQRQKWGDRHDDREHEKGDLAVVAGALAVRDTDAEISDGRLDSVGYDRWGLCAKHNQRNALVTAAALLVAEIERIDRRCRDHLTPATPEGEGDRDGKRKDTDRIDGGEDEDLDADRGDRYGEGYEEGYRHGYERARADAKRCAVSEANYSVACKIRDMVRPQNPTPTACGETDWHAEWLKQCEMTREIAAHRDRLQGEVERAEAELPSSFYADRTLRARVNLMVQQWRHGVEQCQQLDR